MGNPWTGPCWHTSYHSYTCRENRRRSFRLAGNIHPLKLSWHLFPVFLVTPSTAGHTLPSAYFCPLQASPSLIWISVDSFVFFSPFHLDPSCNWSFHFRLPLHLHLVFFLARRCLSLPGIHFGRFRLVIPPLPSCHFSSAKDAQRRFVYTWSSHAGEAAAFALCFASFLHAFFSYPRKFSIRFSLASNASLALPYQICRHVWRTWHPSRTIFQLDFFRERRLVQLSLIMLKWSTNRCVDTCGWTRESTWYWCSPPHIPFFDILLLQLSFLLHHHLHFSSPTDGIFLFSFICLPFSSLSFLCFPTFLHPSPSFD